MNLGFGLGLQYSKLSGGGLEGMLNKFPGASLGLSLDKLDKNYTGSSINVRRSSDNAQLDIGFVKGVIDTESLLDFVGSGNGFVSIIYEQIAGNNFIQNTASLQGQIVSNGSVILKGGKPCIIRSVDDDGGYLSTYAPNDGATVKGMFYVGDNEGNSDNSIFGSKSDGNAYGFFARQGQDSNTDIDGYPIITASFLNGNETTFTTRDGAFNATNQHFILYRAIEFNFGNNLLGLGWRQDSLANIGMMTFQELVIFENTDDAVAKENNINSRYNIY